MYLHAPLQSQQVYSPGFSWHGVKDMGHFAHHIKFEMHVVSRAPLQCEQICWL